MAMSSRFISSMGTYHFAHDDGMEPVYPSSSMPLQESWDTSCYAYEEGVWFLELPPLINSEAPKEFQSRSQRITGEAEHVFTYQRHGQFSCRLLQLPAELRLIILRYLLKSSESIRMCEDLSRKRLDLRGISIVELSAQILRCCQIVLSEGSQILYEQNTLNFHYTTRSPLHGRRLCGFPRRPLFQILMNRFVKIQSPLEDISVSDDLYSYLLQQVSGKSTWTVNDRLVAYYPSLSRIRKVDVQVDCHLHEELYAIVHILRNLLKGKDVAFNIVMLAASDTIRGRPDVLQALQVLRCRSFKFKRTHSTKETDPIVQKITSHEPVVDLLGPWKELRSSIRRVPSVAGQKFENQLETAMFHNVSQDLRDAVFTNDELAFGTLKTLMLGHIERWMDEWATEKRTEAWQQYEKDLASIEDEREQTIQTLNI